MDTLPTDPAPIPTDDESVPAAVATTTTSTAKTFLIIAAVTVLIAGAGVGMWFKFSSKPNIPAAAVAANADAMSDAPPSLSLQNSNLKGSYIDTTDKCKGFTADDVKGKTGDGMPLTAVLNVGSVAKDTLVTDLVPTDPNCLILAIYINHRWEIFPGEAAAQFGGAEKNVYPLSDTATLKRGTGMIIFAKRQVGKLLGAQSAQTSATGEMDTSSLNGGWALVATPSDGLPGQTLKQNPLVWSYDSAAPDAKIGRPFSKINSFDLPAYKFTTSSVAWIRTGTPGGGSITQGETSIPEVQKTAVAEEKKPEIISVTPSPVYAGSVVDIEITGKNFDGNAQVTWADPRLFIADGTVVVKHDGANDLITLRLMVGADSALELKKVTVTNPNKDFADNTTLEVIKKAVEDIVPPPPDAAAVVPPPDQNKPLKNSTTITNDVIPLPKEKITEPRPPVKHPPVIRKVDPPRAYQGDQNKVITLIGEYFTPEMDVKFENGEVDRISIATKTFINDTTFSIRLSLDAKTPLGHKRIIATTVDGSDGNDDFEVLAKKVVVPRPTNTTADERVAIEQVGLKMEGKGHEGGTFFTPQAASSPDPIITSIENSTIEIGGTSDLVITGENFVPEINGNTTISFPSYSGSCLSSLDPVVDSNTTIRVTIYSKPACTVGAYSLEITNPNGKSIVKESAIEIVEKDQKYKSLLDGKQVLILDTTNNTVNTKWKLGKVTIYTSDKNFTVNFGGIPPTVGTFKKINASSLAVHPSTSQAKPGLQVIASIKGTAGSTEYRTATVQKLNDDQTAYVITNDTTPQEVKDIKLTDLYMPGIGEEATIDSSKVKATAQSTLSTKNLTKSGNTGVSAATNNATPAGAAGTASAKAAASAASGASGSGSSSSRASTSSSSTGADRPTAGGASSAPLTFANQFSILTSLKLDPKVGDTVFIQGIKDKTCKDYLWKVKILQNKNPKGEYSVQGIDTQAKDCTETESINKLISLSNIYRSDEYPTNVYENLEVYFKSPWSYGWDVGSYSKAVIRAVSADKKKVCLTLSAGGGLADFYDGSGNIISNPSKSVFVTLDRLIMPKVPYIAQKLNGNQMYNKCKL